MPGSRVGDVLKRDEVRPSLQSSRQTKYRELGAVKLRPQRIQVGKEKTGVKPIQACLLALLLMPRLGLAQTDSPPPAPFSYNPASAAAHAIGAPFRALWKLGGHVPTGTAPGEAESTGVIAFEQVQG